MSAFVLAVTALLFVCVGCALIELVIGVQRRTPGMIAFNLLVNLALAIWGLFVWVGK